MNKNGTTTKGTTRWRCITCGASTTNTRPTDLHPKRFRLFIESITQTPSRTSLAAPLNITRRTLTNWFTNYWLIQVPNNHDPHRIYDQLFIDGTYFVPSCLLVACTTDHVVAWHWCKKENSHTYTKLLEQLPAPLIVTTDGQRGALKAITTQWPTATIQRCLIHIKRNIQTQITLNPKLPAGKALRALSLSLLKITTADQAAAWLVLLQEFHTVYAPWLAEKTYKDDVEADQIPTRFKNNKTWWYTHYRHRSAYHLLEQLARNNQLFTFINPPEGVHMPVKATTNCLEGGINAQLKNLARQHRGMSREHQRTAVDW